MRVGMERAGRRAVDQADQGAAESEIDLRALGTALWRKRLWILIPTVAAALLAFVAVQFVTPRYKSEARVLFEGRENVFLRPEAEKAMNDRGSVDQDSITSQVQLVLSRDLARDVIKQVKLGERPEFDPVLRGPSLPRTILGLVGLGRDPLHMTPEERVMQAYYERLNVYAVEKSRVIVIEFQSEDPDLASRAANAVGEAYLSIQQAAKQDQARAAGQWLAGEITNLRNRVAEAEARVEQFRSKSNLFTGSNNTSLSNQQLGEFSSQLGAARAQKSDAEVRARLIREMLRSGRIIDSSDVLNSELIRRLTEQRIALRAQLAEQSSTLLDGHPRIKELKAQIADLDRQMREEADKLVRALENDAKIAGARVESLSANLDQFKRQASSTSEQDVQLRALEREAKAQRDLLESYLAKYREATTRESIDAAPADARVISRATVSNTPVFPRKLPIVLIATLAAFVLSSGFIATGELLNGSPRPAARPVVLAAVAPATVPIAPEMAPSLPMAEPPRRSADPAPGLAPGLAPLGNHSVGGKTMGDVGSFSDTHPALAVPVSTLEEVARGLRQGGEAGRKVTLVGALRDAATAMTALTLARSLAQDAKVVLVDLAFGGSDIAVVSSEPGAPGLADVIRGTASFGHIITRDTLSSAHLVAAGQAADDAAAILASQRLATTIEALARTYDHVVVHAGAVPDTAVERFARLAPKAVLVAPAPEHPETAAARERLLAAGFSDVTVLVATGAEPETAKVPAEVA
jgi:succinoglycan biosynthesis transport protein ExoP